MSFTDSYRPPATVTCTHWRLFDLHQIVYDVLPWRMVSTRRKPLESNRALPENVPTPVRSLISAGEPPQFPLLPLPQLPLLLLPQFPPP